MKTEDSSAYRLDTIDYAILRELQNDARITLKELALKVNLSTTPVFERWKRLESLGYIARYVTMLEPELLGLELTVFCMVTLQRLSNAVAMNFIKKVTALPEVVECYHVSGQCDYMLKVTVPSMKAYKEFLLNVLGHIDQIGHVESHFIMDTVKQSFSMPLPE